MLAYNDRGYKSAGSSGDSSSDSDSVVRVIVEMRVL